MRSFILALGLGAAFFPAMTLAAVSPSQATTSVTGSKVVAPGSGSVVVGQFNRLGSADTTSSTKSSTRPSSEVVVTCLGEADIDPVVSYTGAKHCLLGRRELQL